MQAGDLNPARQNPVLYASQKLSGEWSAANFAGSLKPDMAASLRMHFGRLDSSVRTRLLLSSLFLRPDQMEGVRGELEALVDAASTSSDEDDWVKVVANAVGRLDGQLDAGRVKAKMKDVKEGLEELRAVLDKAGGQGGAQPTASCFFPLETPYLSHRLMPEAVRKKDGEGWAAPFRLREGAGEDVARGLHSAAHAADSGKAAAGPAGPGAGAAPETPGAGAKGGGAVREPPGSDTRGARSAVAGSAMFRPSNPLQSVKSATVAAAAGGGGGADAAAHHHLAERRPSLSVHGSGGGGVADRRGSMRAIKTKQIDVTEAMQLSREATLRRKLSHRGATAATATTPGGDQTPAKHPSDRGGHDAGGPSPALWAATPAGGGIAGGSGAQLAGGPGPFGAGGGMPPSTDASPAANVANPFAAASAAGSLAAAAAGGAGLPPTYASDIADALGDDGGGGGADNGGGGGADAVLPPGAEEGELAAAPQQQFATHAANTTAVDAAMTAAAATLPPPPPHVWPPPPEASAAEPGSGGAGHAVVGAVEAQQTMELGASVAAASESAPEEGEVPEEGESPEDAA